MGRKTWESLNPKFRPLANRDNIVISHDRSFRAPGATVACDVEEALDLARQEAIPDDGLDRSEIWVIGGAQLFNQMLPLASKVFITQIDANVDALARQEAIPDDGLDRSEIWVIGGAQLFNQMLPLASKVFITQIDANVDADTYAPDLSDAINKGAWKVDERTDWMVPSKAEGIARYRYVTRSMSAPTGWCRARRKALRATVT